MAKIFIKITGLTMLAVSAAIVSSKVQSMLIDEIFNSLEKINKC